MTMGRPPLSATGRLTTAPMTIRLTPELDQALHEHMAATGQSASQTIRDALTAHLHPGDPGQDDTPAPSRGADPPSTPTSCKPNRHSP